MIVLEMIINYFVKAITNPRIITNIVLLNKSYRETIAKALHFLTKKFYDKSFLHCIEINEPRSSRPTNSF